LTGFPSFTRIVVIVAALVTAGVACGQAPGGTSRGGSRGGGLDTSHVPPSKPDQDANTGVTLLSTVQYRLELLEEDLRLLPEQRSAWQTYRERVLRLAEDTQRAARTALGGDMPAPKRLDRLADIARDRLTAIEDIVDAGKHLYATLTPGQQTVADRRMAVPVMALAGVEPNSGTARAGAGGKNP
jgi:LTXXQ motif family protein